MQHDSAEKSKVVFRTFISFFSAFGFWLLGGPLLSMLAHDILPNTIDHFLFFQPQVLLPYGQLALSTAAGYFDVLPDGMAWLLISAQWSLVFAVFARFAHKLSFRWQFSLALATITLTGIAVEAIIEYLGYTIVLDGP